MASIEAKRAESALTLALSEAGCRITRPRRAVIRALAEAEECLEPAQIWRRARRRCASTALVTVYRTIDVLLQLELVRRIHLPRGECRYALARLQHGHHVVCRRCSRAVEFKGDDLGALFSKVSRSTGFEVQDHSLELFGLCPSCRQRTGST